MLDTISKMIEALNYDLRNSVQESLFYEYRTFLYALYFQNCVCIERDSEIHNLEDVNIKRE